MRATREVGGQARQPDPDEADVTVPEPPRRGDGHHLFRRVAHATIASRSTSIPEITGAAAILVDPLDVAGLADTLLRLSNDQKLRKTLSTKARDRAGNFQWETSARQLSDLYQLAMKTSKREPGTNFK